MQSAETPVDGRMARGCSTLSGEDALPLPARLGLETSHRERQHYTPAHAASKQAKTVNREQNYGARRWAVCVCVCGNAAGV